MLPNSEKDFLKRHIGPSKEDQLKMLKELNYKSLDDLINNTVPEKGSNVEKDGTAGVVESTKAASDVYTPVSGEVVDTNQAIVDDPSKINEDPENTAWFFKLKIKDLSEMETLMNKDDYDKFAKESSA